MQTTGIVRRIDDLGRIVIPKEIRSKFDIKNGENIEIFVNDEMIGLKKYSELDKYKKISKVLTDLFDIHIIDTSEIDDKFYKILIERKDYTSLIKEDMLKFTDKYFYIKPLILNGDIIGSIFTISDKQIDVEKINIVNMCSKIFLNYIES